MTSRALWSSVVWALAGAGLGRAFHPVAHRLCNPLSCRWTAVQPTIATVATSILFGLLAWRVGVRAELLAYSCVALVSVPLALTDIAELRLPSRLVWPACLATAALFALAAFLDQNGEALLRAIAGMVALPAWYLMLALMSRGGLGAGDVRLAALVGLALGWRSWAVLTAGTLIALGYAGVAGLVAIVVGRASRNSPIPYGPAMIAGAFTVVLATPQVP